MEITFLFDFVKVFKEIVFYILVDIFTLKKKIVSKTFCEIYLIFITLFL